jgi:hypothetical protein
MTGARAVVKIRPQSGYSLFFLAGGRGDESTTEDTEDTEEEEQ